MPHGCRGVLLSCCRLVVLYRACAVVLSSCVFIKYCGDHSCHGLLHNQSLQHTTKASYTGKQCTTEKNINYYKSEIISPTRSEAKPMLSTSNMRPSFSSCKGVEKKKKLEVKEMKLNLAIVKIEQNTVARTMKE